MTVALPETAQELVGGRRQRHQAILVALGIADMHTPARAVDVGDRQPQAFAQAQAETVEGEEEDPVTEHLRGQKNPLGLLDRDDVRQALRARRFDQTGRHPGFLQHVLVVELEPVQIELERTPGVRLTQVGEVIQQVGLAQIVDLMSEVVSHPAHGARIRLDRLRLQALERQVLLVELVVRVKIRRCDSGYVFHLAVTSHSS